MFLAWQRTIKKFAEFRENHLHTTTSTTTTTTITTTTLQCLLLALAKGRLLIAILHPRNTTQKPPNALLTGIPVPKIMVKPTGPTAADSTLFTIRVYGRRFRSIPPIAKVKKAKDQLPSVNPGH